MAPASVSRKRLLPTRKVVMAQGAPHLTRIVALAVPVEGLGLGDSVLARPCLEAPTTLAAVVPCSAKEVLPSVP
jgi:hypothetical protein